MIPYGSVRSALHLTRACAIPLLNAYRAPLRPGIRQHRLQCRPAFAFEPRPACGPRGAVGRGIIEGRVKAQPRDHTGAGQRLDFVKEFQHCKTAVGDTDNLPFRHPTPQEPSHLPGSFRQRLMAAAALRIEAFGGT